jgi:4-hydroxythreonine-4-phosphate dehydrogenase
MAFWSRALAVSLVTTHLALAKVPRAVTPAAVARATYWLAALLSQLSHRRVRIAVAALNPHAGESGLFGREERTRIAPGIARAEDRLARARIAADVVGPVPAESALRLAASRRFDGVVCMFHDQATIAMKLASFGEAVNVSLGLPIVRTSVDHGTAYDLAGKWAADASGMGEAVALAARLASARQ